MEQIQLYDVVALMEAIPQHRLSRGQVGTVVERLDRGAFEVEFSDNEGRTYASIGIPSDQLMVLHYEPVAA